MNKQLLTTGSNSSPSQTLTNYYALSSGPSESWSSGIPSSRSMMIAADGVIKNLYVEITSAPGVGRNFTFRISKNSVTQDTGPTVVISDSSTSGQDLVNELQVAAGDIVALVSTPNGTPSSAGSWRVVAEIEYDQSRFCMMAGSSSNLFSSASRQYHYLTASAGTAWTTTNSIRNLIMPLNCTLKDFYVQLSSVATGGDYEFSIFKNGVQVAESIVNITAGTTTASIQNIDISCSAGDTLMCSVLTDTSVSTAPWVIWGASFEPENVGEFAICGATVSNIGDGNYNSPHSISTLTSTETTFRQLMAPATYGLIVKNLYVGTITAPGNGKSRIYTLRKNQASTNCSATISDTNTVASDTSHAVGFVSGDYASILHNTTGSPTSSGQHRWSMVGEITSVISVADSIHVYGRVNNIDPILILEPITVLENVQDTYYIFVQDTKTVSDRVYLGSRRYWVGGTGTWSDTSHWSYTSGGATGAPAPTSLTPVIFDANSFSADGQTVTITSSASTGGLDFSAITKQTNVAFSGSPDLLNFNGNVILSPLLRMRYTSSNFLQIIGENQTQDIVFNANGAILEIPMYFYLDKTLILGGDLKTDRWIYIYNYASDNYTGHFDTGGYDMEFNYMGIYDNRLRVSFRDSTITLVGDDAGLDTSASGVSIDAGTSTIVFDDSVTGQPSLYFEHPLYNLVIRSSVAWLDGLLSFNDVTINDMTTVEVDNLAVIHINGTLMWESIHGSSLEPDTIDERYYLVSPNDVTNVSNLTIRGSRAQTEYYSYNIDDIIFSPHTLTGAAIDIGTLGDDSYSGPYNMPFDFAYFESNPTVFYIGSNGIVGLDGIDNNYEPYSIPNWYAGENEIYGFTGDLYPPSGGTIKYEIFGNTPNRVLVVEFANIRDITTMLDTANTFQIKLFETSNIIEIHALSCPNPKNRYYLQGLNTASGFYGAVQPSRNVMPFSLTNDAVRFTPRPHSHVRWFAKGNSVDAGNNTGWTYPPTPPTWTDREPFN